LLFSKLLKVVFVDFFKSFLTEVFKRLDLHYLDPSCIDLLNIDFMEVLEMIWISQDLVIYFMKKANETYLTTKNKQIVSNIEFNQQEQSFYYLHKFVLLIESEFLDPRDDIQI
ncbi:19757_t:CDS:1, partial [Dentiscutata erythropus]